jgi:hypothetical protein
VIIYFDGPTKIDLVGSHPGLDHIGRTTYRRVA